ncbi:MAG: hypothetical protein IJE71_06345, partial [Clostridia bacterium]|nr:hypothetical protein [Clostridia bacterium]
MIEQDTVRLLRECDAGVRMGVSSIDDVLPRVQDIQLRRQLRQSKAEHEKLKTELQQALERFHDEGKEPGIMAKTMSAFKTNLELTVDPSDHTIADLMTDGCNMGVKSLSKYLNQYKAADESAKDVCKRLIHLEEQLA